LNNYVTVFAAELPNKDIDNEVSLYIDDLYVKRNRKVYLK